MITKSSKKAYVIYDKSEKGFWSLSGEYDAAIENSETWDDSDEALANIGDNPDEFVKEVIITYEVKM